MSRVSISALVTSPSVAQRPIENTPTLISRNGRLYWSNTYPNYPFPHDYGATEMLNILHAMIYSEALNGFHRARLETPRGGLRVLDVGHGSGLWLIEMCSEKPLAQVFGIDLAPAPASVPCQTKVADFENDDWGFPEGSFDYIHMAQLCGSVSSWPDLCARALRYLVPGTGRLEIVEIDWEPCCDDDTLWTDPKQAFRTWWDTIVLASQRAGKPIAYPHGIARTLEETGFEVETNESVMIRSWEPPGLTTEEEKRASRITEYYKWAMGYAVLQDPPGPPLRSFSGLSMELFTRFAGWSPAQVEQLQDDMYPNVMANDVHLYHRLRIVTARRRR